MDGKNINNKWCKCFPLITECWKAGKWFNNDRNSQETRNRHFYSTDLSFVFSLRSLTPSLTRVGGLGSFLDLGFLGEPYWFLQQVLAAIQTVGFKWLWDIHLVHFQATLILQHGTVMKQVRKSKVTFEVHHPSKYQSFRVSKITTSRRFYRTARAFGERFS